MAGLGLDFEKSTFLNFFWARGFRPKRHAQPSVDKPVFPR
jgi:hypothetical protein